MTLDEKKTLMRDAKHSMIVFISTLGTSSYAASGFFVKWPDVVDALLAGDDKLFLADMGVLICAPIRVIAASVAQMSESKMAPSMIEDAVRTQSTDPHLTKAKLMSICNQEITFLKQKGAKINFDLLKGIDDD